MGRQRFETRPAVSPTQSDFATTEFFKDFDFTPSVNQAKNQFNLVTEAPRSAFQLEQNFRGNTEQEQELQVQRQQIIINPAPPQPIQQNIQTPQRFQPAAPIQTQPIQQPQRFQPTAPLQTQPIQQPIQTPQRFQPTAPLQTQPTPQVPQIPIPAQPQRINNQQQVLSQNPFNLLNTNNFNAFDAQFGGSVPTNPGASQLTSDIFSQPQTALLQGRDVLVNPQNNFQGTPIQTQQFQATSIQTQQFQATPIQTQQFQATPIQTQQFQPAPTQFSNVNVPSASFSGHPANDINLQTGAFNLRTG